MKINRGFTLIEMMLTSAIIGLLAAIAIPKFGNMIIKAREATVRANLGVIRSAFSIYYADNEGLLPSGPGGTMLTTNLTPKYLEKVPLFSIPTHPRHPAANGVYYSQVTLDGVWDRFRWSIVNSNTRLWINCTHTDTSGRQWSTW